MENIPPAPDGTERCELSFNPLIGKYLEITYTVPLNVLKVKYTMSPRAKNL